MESNEKKKETGLCYKKVLDLFAIYGSFMSVQTTQYQNGFKKQGQS
jgi:hypothetical protein